MTLADDCERLVQILAGAPKGGMTMTDMHNATGWTLVRVNDILCSLGKSIQFTKGRERGKKVTKYSLRDML